MKPDEPEPDPADEPKGDAPKGDTPDPAAEAAKLLADAKAMIADNAKQASSLAAIASRVLDRDQRRDDPPAARIDDDEPEPELDLTDPKLVAKEITRRAEKVAERLLTEKLKDLTGRYMADRTDDLRSRETTTREQLRNSLPGFKEVEAEIDTYLTPFRAQDPSIGGRTGALEEAYLRVLGKKEHEARIAKAARAGSVTSSTRSSALDQTAPRFDKETIEAAERNLRIKFEDADELEALEDGKNVEDFARYLLKKQQKRSA